MSLLGVKYGSAFSAWNFCFLIPFFLLLVCNPYKLTFPVLACIMIW